MATIKEVKEGFYLISWSAQNLNVLNPPIVRVDFKKCFPTYTCNLLSRIDNDHYSLKMEILDERSRKPIFPNEFKKVVATIDEIQEQKMTQCHSPFCHQEDQTSLIWLALWPLSSRRLGRPSSSAKFEIAIKTLSTSQDSIKCRKRLKTIHHTINLFRENKAFGDIVAFKCGNEIIKGHPSVLAASSPVFSYMFQHDFFKENNVIPVEIQDTKPDIFQQLVQFIYIQDVDLENVDVIGLFQAADKYCVDSLKTKCATHLSKSLTVENATRCLVLAHLHNAPSLTESALNFVARNAKTICFKEKHDWMTIIKTFPDLAFQVIQFMAENI